MTSRSLLLLTGEEQYVTIVFSLAWIEMFHYQNVRLVPVTVTREFKTSIYFFIVIIIWANNNDAMTQTSSQSIESNMCAQN
jgi:hypothetical protein